MPLRLISEVSVSIFFVLVIGWGVVVALYLGWRQK